MECNTCTSPPSPCDNRRTKKSQELRHPALAPAPKCSIRGRRRPLCANGGRRRMQNLRQVFVRASEELREPRHGGEGGERGQRGIKTTIEATTAGWAADKNPNNEVHTQLEHLGKERRHSRSSRSRCGSHLGKLIRNCLFRFGDAGTNNEVTLRTC